MSETIVDAVLPAKKKRKISYYTKAEDQLILDIVMQYPDNLSFGFNEAAKRLKTRKVNSVSSRYYYLINTGKKKSTVVTGSAAGFSASKNVKSKDGKLMRKEPLRPLIAVFKQLLELNPAELKKIKEFINTIE